METTQYLLIPAAFLLAALVVFFQYFYKRSLSGRLTYILSFLRFISIFAVLLLILNLKISRTVSEIIKPKLILLADNSSSIKFKKQDSLIKILIQDLGSDKEISKRFDIRNFNFARDLKTGKALNFNESETNIYQSLSDLKELFKEENAPVVLLTVGNQTFGNDYKYFKTDQPVFPVILGDTTRFNDLFISNLSVNPYTYSDHRFPVELFVSYEGNKPVATELLVYNREKVIFKKKLTLNTSEKSSKIDFMLPALTKGKHFYRVAVKPLNRERNRLNNVKEFSIEVLDESSNILLLYDVLHPDIACWKRTVESNKLRKIRIERINDFNGNLSDYQFVILFQPNEKFKDVFSKKVNMLIQTGVQTDWNFLNRNQQLFKKNFLDKTQQVSPVYNKEFSIFLVKDLDFEKLPPLQNTFGQINFNVPHHELLFQGINNIKTEMPLLTTLETEKQRIVLLEGENIFAWRSYSYLDNRSFENFDKFTNSLFQFLQDQGNRKTLEVDVKPIFFENEKIVIRASHYTANYDLDTVAELKLKLYDQNHKVKRVFPMFLNGNRFEAQLQDLDPGIYSFSVEVTGQKKGFKGKFKILGFNQEKQMLRSDYSALMELAGRNSGKVYFPAQISDLKKALKGSDRFKPIQKEVKIEQSLIDWKWLLSLIILSLSIEWFIRKYHGLI
jgi:hypothetical protein